MPDLTIARGQEQAEAVIRARLDASAATVPVTMVVRGGRSGPRRSSGSGCTATRRCCTAPAAIRCWPAAGRRRPSCAFTKAVEAGVADPFVYNNRGMAYFALNQIDQAIRDYTEASRLRPAIR